MKKYICGKKYELCGILKDNSCCRGCKNFDKCFATDMLCKDYDKTLKLCCSGNMYVKEKERHIEIADRLKDNNSIYTIDYLLEIQAILKGYENKDEYLNSLITDETKKIYKLIKRNIL